MAFGDYYQKKARVLGDRAAQEPYTDASAYRKALEQAAYGDAGAEYGAGLKQVTNYLAGAGPMADSGGATALRRNLYSDIYGKARSRIGGGYAEYLASVLSARRNYLYQRELMKLANKQKKTGVGGVLGGLAGAGLGALAGGPMGASAGYNVGSNVGGNWGAF